MTTVLIFVLGVAIIAGVVWVMMRMERSHRQRMQRNREVWRNTGSVGVSRTPGHPPLNLENASHGSSPVCRRGYRCVTAALSAALAARLVVGGYPGSFGFGHGSS